MSAEPLAFLNGEFLPYSQAKLSLHDAGFVFGATVTDFCRTFRQQLFRWSDHLTRFRKNCTQCFFPISQTDEQLTNVANELVAHNAKIAGQTAELALISFATPGEIGYFIGQHGGAGDSSATVGMHTIVLNRQRYRRFFEGGIDLISVDLSNDFVNLAQVKHRSRMHWWYAEQWIKTFPDFPAGALPIYEHPKVGMLDTAIGSFLLVNDGVVRCADRSWILDSISFSVLAEICQALDIPLEQMNLTLQRCQFADEALLTGTAFCLAPVRSIRHYYGTLNGFNPPGPIFERLLKAFSDLVGVDIRADFLRFP